MLRRKNASSVADSASSPSSNNSSSSPRRRTGFPNNNKNASRSTTVDVSIVTLLVLAILLTLATYLFPAEMNHVEQQAEDEFMQMWHPPLGGGASSARTKQKQQQQQELPWNEMSTQWVDGEKKLKQRLEILARRQAQGQDIGVPVLTRWLGEEIPAWPTDPDNPMDLDVWNKKVEEKYAQMRVEETQWRAQMAQHLNADLG